MLVVPDAVLRVGHSLIAVNERFGERIRRTSRLEECIE